MLENNRTIQWTECPYAYIINPCYGGGPVRQFMNMKINVAPNGNAEDRRIQSYNPYYSNIIAVGYNILRRYYYVLLLLILCFLYRHARAPRKVLIMRTLWHLGDTVKKNMLNTVIFICTFSF